MTFLRAGFAEIRPPPYLQVEGSTEDAIKLTGTPTILGDMKGKMEIYFTAPAVVIYRGSGVIAPYQNDVLWQIRSVTFSHFDYEIFSQVDEMDSYAQRVRSYNEITYAVIQDDEVYQEINGFEIEVFANTEDPSTWGFRVVDVY